MVVQKLVALVFLSLIFTSGCSNAYQVAALPKKVTLDSSDVVKMPTIQALEINKTIKLNGQAIIMNPENVTVNVNHANRLPVLYEPDDLVVANVRYPYSGVEERSYLRREAAEAVEELFLAAEEIGHILYFNSGYRPYLRQYELFQNAQLTHGYDQTTVAKPGYSEHQTGLAVDISSNEVNFSLTKQFGLTEEGMWVADHAHLFGFIIRYPEGKEEITGYQYEPWHLRYVGEIAADIYNQSITFEEYLQIVKKM